MTILYVLIVQGFAVNALMDGINFSKSPLQQDLRILWHLAKYIWAGIILLTGAWLYKHLMIMPLSVLGLHTICASFIGAMLWRVTYKIYRNIKWPPWA